MFLTHLLEAAPNGLNTPVNPIVGALVTVLGFTVVVVTFAAFLKIVRKNKK